MSRARLIGLAVVTATLVAGAAVAAPAEATARYSCGKQCNGHTPTWVIPSNGVRCSKSAKLVGSGHPWSGSDYSKKDTGMTVKVYYSTVCQTLWEVISNSHSDFNPGGGWTPFWSMTHTAGYTYQKNGALPSKGHSVTTVMVDDHAANYGKAAEAYVQEFTSTSYRSQHIWVFTY